MAERITVSLTGRLGTEAGALAADPAALGPLGALALAFLVTERRRPVPREELADVLWGEELPPTWEASLRSVVSRVRRRLRDAGLPEDVIAGGRSGYQLHLPDNAVVDVEEAAADIVRAREALSRREGVAAVGFATAAVEVAARPFLPGVGGLWAERRQAAHADLHMQALDVLSEAAQAAGHHRVAVAAAEAAVAAQPLRESSHVRAMAAYARAGSRGEALRAFERCRRMLADELGTPPSAATEAAYLALLADDDTDDSKGPPTNLGTELSTFVGRSQELRDVSKQLGTNRLLTLVGPGGVGKTRLALRAAAQALDDHADGVWVVELAPLSDPVLLASYILAALRLEEAGAAPAEALRRHLAERNVLLVLDNCEHLTAVCAGLVKELLTACRGLTVLVTSREPLGIAGESLCPVPPLSLPPAAENTPNVLWESEAARLFLERAAAANPRFALSTDNATAVADLCRRLDGLPLAIELAAARARSLSVPEIAARLRDRFRLLVSRDPTAPGRHRTLEATVSWSYEALPPDEQLLFRTLAVFAGTFTVDAAEAICGDGRDEVVEALASLVDKSLVIADASGAVTRYRLLETLRQYGAERLTANGEEAAARARHLAWACTLAEQAEPGLEGGDQARWLQTLDAEEDNVRAALEWAVAHPGSDEGLRAAAALWRYWQVRSRFTEGWHWLRALLDADTGEAPSVRAKAVVSAAILALHEPDAYLTNAAGVRALFDEARAIRRQTGDRRGEAVALHGLGGLYFRQRDRESAAACFEETLAIGRELGDKRLVAASLTNLTSMGLARLYEGDQTDPKRPYEEALAIWRDLGDHFATARALGDLAGLASFRGQHTLATSLLRETSDLQRQIDDRRGLAQTIQQLAGVARRQEDFAGARSLLEESLAIKRELRDPVLVAQALLELGDLWSMDGGLAQARQLFEEAAAVARPLKLRLPIVNALGCLGDLALIEGRIADARRLFDEATEIARQAPDLSGERPWRMSVRAVASLAEGDPVGAGGWCRRVLEVFAEHPHRPSEMFATVLDVLAVLAADDGDLERAAQLVGAAHASRGAPKFAPFRSRPEFQQALAAMRAGLGDAAFEQAQGAGAALPLDDAQALAQSALA